MLMHLYSPHQVSGALFPTLQIPSTKIVSQTHLGDVVGDVVHHVHVQVVGRLAKHLGKRLLSD